MLTAIALAVVTGQAWAQEGYDHYRISERVGRQLVDMRKDVDDSLVSLAEFFHETGNDNLALHALSQHSPVFPGNRYQRYVDAGDVEMLLHMFDVYQPAYYQKQRGIVEDALYRRDVETVMETAVKLVAAPDSAFVYARRLDVAALDYPPMTPVEGFTELLLVEGLLEPAIEVSWKYLNPVIAEHLLAKKRWLFSNAASDNLDRLVLQRADTIDLRLLLFIGARAGSETCRKAAVEQALSRPLVNEDSLIDDRLFEPAEQLQSLLNSLLAAGEEGLAQKLFDRHSQTIVDGLTKKGGFDWAMLITMQNSGWRDQCAQLALPLKQHLLQAEDPTGLYGFPSDLYGVAERTVQSLLFADLDEEAQELRDYMLPYFGNLKFLLTGGYYDALMRRGSFRQLIDARKKKSPDTVSKLISSCIAYALGRNDEQTARDLFEEGIALAFASGDFSNISYLQNSAIRFKRQEIYKEAILKKYERGPEGVTPTHAMTAVSELFAVGEHAAARTYVPLARSAVGPRVGAMFSANVRISTPKWEFLRETYGENFIWEACVEAMTKKDFDEFDALKMLTIYQGEPSRAEVVLDRLGEIWHRYDEEYRDVMAYSLLLNQVVSTDNGVPLKPMWQERVMDLVLTEPPRKTGSA